MDKKAWPTHMLPTRNPPDRGCCSFSPGVLSHLQLQESGPGLVNPLQTLSLTCTLSEFSLMSYGVHWNSQAPSKELEWVNATGSDGRTDSKPMLTSRLIITRDISESLVYLTPNSRVPETQPYITVLVTQWGEGGRSPDTNLLQDTGELGCREHLGHQRLIRFLLEGNISG